jgi:hypothetical protein
VCKKQNNICINFPGVNEFLTRASGGGRVLPEMQTEPVTLLKWPIGVGGLRAIQLMGKLNCGPY